MRQTLGLFEIFRIRQQIKNLLVIVPFFFSLNLWYSNNELGQSFLIFSWVIGGVLVFSLASWAVYLFNDVIDADLDLIHESKIDYHRDSVNTGCSLSSRTTQQSYSEYRRQRLCWRWEIQNRLKF